jgi:membrane protein Man1
MNISLEGTEESMPIKPIIDPEVELMTRVKTPLCAEVLSSMKGSNDISMCLQSLEDKEPAVYITRRIVDIFENRLLNHLCLADHDDTSSPLDPSKMTLKEIREELVPLLLKEKHGMFSSENDHEFDRATAIPRINKAINDAITVIHHNKRFKITAEEDPITKNQVLRVDSNTFPVTWPVSCKLKFALNNAFWNLVVFASIVAVASGIYFFVDVRKKKEFQEYNIFCELLEKSLELLQSPDEPGSMPVLHIRDTVLSSTEKKDPTMLRVWDKVVRHVENTESRVKVTTEEIEGETFKTWKWVCPIVFDGTGNIKTGSIEWKGQATAFASQRHSFAPRQSIGKSSASSASGVATSTFIAPTNFLKVRNMFDEKTVADARSTNDYLWKTRIRNAILGKVSIDSPNGHGICHLFVDERFAKEGLVYIKCRDIPSASLAYNALHAWWCQTRMVSVRFLKPERYYSRFPDARHQESDLKIELTDELD